MRRVIGINQRNAIIGRSNPRHAIRLVRDKYETKRVLAACDVPVPPTLLTVREIDQVATMPLAQLGESWVMKPIRGSQGRGVLIATGRLDAAASGWLDASGGSLTDSAVRRHAEAIIEGEFTDDRADAAIAEPLLRSHPDLASIAPVGLPDVRVIVHRRRPVMAMLRIPTRASGGRGNLHQGGIGAGIDLTTGTITRAIWRRHEIATHPETGVELVGAVVPDWHRIIEVASRCADATGLGYLGADIVVDSNLGVAVLEVNAHPGLEIQNVCGQGLGAALAAVATDH